MPDPGRPVRLFVSYSHRDEEARRRLDTHMAQLKREGVEVFFDGNILPGDELDAAIRKELWRADVFVALASPDYLSSRYCYEIEYGYAMRKAGRRSLHVVVAVLRACQWRHTRMARYKLLPNDGKPVDQWARRGDAYEDIMAGIRKVVQAIERERSVPSDAAVPVGAERGVRSSKTVSQPAAKPRKTAVAAKGAEPKPPAVRGKAPKATVGFKGTRGPRAATGTAKRMVGRKGPKTSR